MLPFPAKLESNPVFGPALSLCRDVLLTTDEVAKHYRYTDQYLHNLRRQRRGPAFLKLSVGTGGAVRYRLADVMAWELTGQGCGLTVDRVAIVLATVPGLSLVAQQAILSHLDAAFNRG